MEKGQIILTQYGDPCSIKVKQIPKDHKMTIGKTYQILLYHGCYYCYDDEGKPTAVVIYDYQYNQQNPHPYFDINYQSETKIIESLKESNHGNNEGNIHS